MAPKAPNRTATAVWLVALEEAQADVIRSAMDRILPGQEALEAATLDEIFEPSGAGPALVFVDARGCGSGVWTDAEFATGDDARRVVVVLNDEEFGDRSFSRDRCIRLPAGEVREDVIAGIFLTKDLLFDQGREISRHRGDLRTIARKVNHDIRSSLGCVVTNNDLLRELLESPGEFEDILGSIDEAAAEISDLVDRVCLIARVAGQRKQAEVFSSRDSYWEAWDQSETTFNRCGAQISQPDEWPEVWGVPGWCTTIWRALLENAARHGGPNARIEVGWTGLDGAFRFHVRDFGPGVSPAAGEKLFLPFERLADLRSSCGFGLTLVQRLVTLQEGTCGHEWPSDGRGGSCFHFTLPAPQGVGGAAAETAMQEARS